MKPTPDPFAAYVAELERMIDTYRQLIVDNTLLQPYRFIVDKDKLLPQTATAKLLGEDYEKQASGLYTKPVDPDLEDLYAMPSPISYRFSFSAAPPPSYHPSLFRRRYLNPVPNPPNEPEFEVNLMEALVGWKAWSVDEKGLWSVQQAGQLWPADQPFVAQCVIQEHSWTDHQTTKCNPAVTQGHTCGIYAGTRREAESYVREYPDEADNILGEVYGWGRYVRGDVGWRAQFAYPKNFFLRAHQVPFIEYLRPYHVPIYVEQPTLIYNPEEDGYECRTDEADGDLGTTQDPTADEEDGTD